MVGRGLGDTSACGNNPCGLWDMVYASDACVAYKLCVNPNDPTAILESQGLIAGTGTVLGQTAGSTVSNTVSSAIDSIVIDPVTGGPNWVMLGTAALVLYILMKK